MYQISGAEWVVVLVLSFLWAWFGYRLSENDRRTLGRTPWGLPSALWALFWFINIILGLVLFLIAHANGVRRAQQTLGGPANAAASSAPQTMAERFPTYPRPANSVQTAEPVPPTPADGRGNQPAPVPSSPEVSPPAWHPDPGGRYQYRWWDGTQWTPHVAMNGQVFTDTSRDQRIGPY